MCFGMPRRPHNVLLLHLLQRIRVANEGTARALAGRPHSRRHRVCTPEPPSVLGINGYGFHAKPRPCIDFPYQGRDFSSPHVLQSRLLISCPRHKRQRTARGSGESVRADRLSQASRLIGRHAGSWYATELMPPLRPGAPPRVHAAKSAHPGRPNRKWPSLTEPQGPALRVDEPIAELRHDGRRTRQPCALAIQSNDKRIRGEQHRVHRQAALTNRSSRGRPLGASLLYPSPKHLHFQRARRPRLHTVFPATLKLALKLSICPQRPGTLLAPTGCHARPSNAQTGEKSCAVMG
jgi:hypothetical protein